SGDEENQLAINGGLLEVRPDEVTILAQTAERPEDIDVDRARRAKERAERRLQQSKQDNVDFHGAELALKRAINRLKVAQYIRMNNVKSLIICDCERFCVSTKIRFSAIR